MPPSSQRAIAEIEDDYLEYETLTRSGRRFPPPAAPAAPEEEEEYAELVVSAVPERRTAPHSVAAPRALAAFSSLEEDFFAAGEALSEIPDDAAENFADLEAPARRPVSLWRRVLG
jgi:hypothetical protein